MDCSVVPTRIPGVVMVSTTDFFFPLVQDPYLQGRIACANVVSDMYAVGVTEIDNMLMLLCACDAMSPVEQDAVLSEMMRGFTDAAQAAGTRVTGGQTTFNAAPLIGGVAMSAVPADAFMSPDRLQPGDVLVLTKPLGTQIAVNLDEWQLRNPQRYAQCVPSPLAPERAARVVSVAHRQMARLNRPAALAMRACGAHGATDVTGFGILGHAHNLAQHQRADVDLVLRVLPLIDGVLDVVAATGAFARVRDGYAAETSGGLLVALDRERVEEFRQRIRDAEGEESWVVGEVVPGTKRALLSADVQFVNV